MYQLYDAAIVNRIPSKLSLLFIILVLVTSTACTTIANRRDLYFPQTVWGPYTKMLHHGVPKPVLEKVMQGTKSSASDGKTVVKPQG